jgi:hypothetical protein
MSTREKYIASGIKYVKEINTYGENPMVMYELSLYDNGMTKDSTKRRYPNNSKQTDDITQTFYPSGSEDEFTHTKIYDKSDFVRASYTYEGNRMIINESVQKSKQDEKGRLIYSSTVYNKTHEISQRYEFTDSTELKTVMGPIGDIVSRTTYKLNSKGFRISAYDNLEGKIILVDEEYMQDTLLFNNKVYEISVYISNTNPSYSSSSVKITEKNSDSKTIVTFIDCEKGETVQDIILGIKAGSLRYRVDRSIITEIDEHDNKISEINRKGLEGEINWSFKSSHIYDDAGNISQTNNYDEAGNISSKSVYTYNNCGDVVNRKSIKIKDNTIKNTSYEYNSYGLLLLESTSKDGEFVRSVEFIYN